MNYYRLHLITLPLVLVAVFALGGMSFPGGIVEAALMLFSLAFMLIVADILFVLIYGSLCLLMSTLRVEIPLLVEFGRWLYNNEIDPSE